RSSDLLADETLHDRVVRSRDPDPGFERIAAAAVFLGQRAAALGGDRHPGGAPVARPHLDAAARIGLRRLQDQSAIGAGPGAAGGMGGGAAGAAPADPGLGIAVSIVSPLQRYSWASAPPPWAGTGIRVARPSPARTSTLPPESACDGCRTRVPLALVQVPLAAWVAVPRALRPPR